MTQAGSVGAERCRCTVGMPKTLMPRCVEGMVVEGAGGEGGSEADGLGPGLNSCGEEELRALVTNLPQAWPCRAEGTGRSGRGQGD